MSEKMTEREELEKILGDLCPNVVDNGQILNGRDCKGFCTDCEIDMIISAGFRKVDEALVEKIGDMVERNIRVDGFFSPAEIAAKVLEDSR